MEHHDWEGDGLIDMDEFNYAYNSMNGGFGYYDENYYHYIGTDKEEWTNLASSIDTNGDGFDMNEL